MRRRVGKNGLVWAVADSAGCNPACGTGDKATVSFSAAGVSGEAAAAGDQTAPSPASMLRKRIRFFIVSAELKIERHPEADGEKIDLEIHHAARPFTDGYLVVHLLDAAVTDPHDAHVDLEGHVVGGEATSPGEIPSDSNNPVS